MSAPKTGKWGEASREAIKEATMVWCDSRGSMPSPSMTESEKKKYLYIVDKHYPFGERAMFPYKAWLKERRAVVKWLWPDPVDMNTGLFAEAGGTV